MSNIIINSYRYLQSLLTFNSLYESFQDLTYVQPKHFIEWFSGSAISTEWTEQNITNTGTYGMEDSIDGGYYVTCNSGADSISSVNFNDKRHYSPTESVIIFDMKTDSINSNQQVCGGFVNAGTQDFDATAGGVCVGSSSTVGMAVRSSSSTSQTDTTIDATQDSDWNNYKLECTSTNVQCTRNGILVSTTTVDRPTLKQQPFMLCTTGGAGGAKTGHWRYLEAYDTDTPIESSLYERFSPLTQLMNQRVVEEFSGASPDGQRWTNYNGGGSGISVTNSDTLNGGVIVTSNTSSGGSFWFNNIRQYDPLNSVIIAVVEPTATTFDGGFGLSNQINFHSDGHFATVHIYSPTPLYYLYTGDPTRSEVATTVAIDLNVAHSHKIDLGATAITLTIDGVLEVTKTTNRPTLKLQPDIMYNSMNGLGFVKYRYLEAYNKLAVESDYPSYYEMFNPLTSVAPSHFVEWFDGSALNTNRWHASFGTVTIIDGIGEGLKQTTGSTIYDKAGVYFNNKRQYDPRNCEIIFITKTEGSNQHVNVGIADNADIRNTATSMQALEMNSDRTYFGLASNDTVVSSVLDSTVARDTSYHVYKITGGASNIKMSIDGVLEVTKTTDRPTAICQPATFTLTTDASQAHDYVRYLECYNLL